MIHHPECAVSCDGCDFFVDKDLAYGYCGNDTFMPQLYCPEMLSLAPLCRSTNVVAITCTTNFCAQACPVTSLILVPVCRNNQF